MNSRVRAVVIVLALSVACRAQSTTPASTAGMSDQASPSSQQPSATHPQSGEIVGGRLLHKEDPKYPKQARKQKLEGQVVLLITVNEGGSVSSVSVLSGEPVLGSSALSAALKWKFEPFTQNGHAVRVQRQLTFKFVPDRKTAELALLAAAPNSLQSAAASHPPITIRNSRPGATGSAPPQLRSLKPLAGVYRVGGGVSAPRVLYSPDPEYSDEARNAKYQGVCVLSIIVGPDGLPRDIKVFRSLGMGLDEKAVEAVKQWKFEPAKKNGQPVPVAINVEVDFRL